MQIDLIGPADAAPPSLTIPFLQPHLVAATAAPLLLLQQPASVDMIMGQHQQQLSLQQQVAFFQHQQEVAMAYQQQQLELLAQQQQQQAAGVGFAALHGRLGNHTCHTFSVITHLHLHFRS